MMLSAADDNDIREAFDVLDDEKDDYICLERLELLILGLGFADRVDVDVLERQLSEQAVGVSDKARIPLETVLRIVETYYTPSLRDRTRFMQETFRLIDTDHKGFINPHDVLNLVECCSDVPYRLSKEQALQMIDQVCAFSHYNTSSDVSTNNKHVRCLDEAAFQRFFEAPDISTSS